MNSVKSVTVEANRIARRSILHKAVVKTCGDALRPYRTAELQRLSLEGDAVEITANYEQFVTGTRA